MTAIYLQTFYDDGGEEEEETRRAGWLDRQALSVRAVLGGVLEEADLSAWVQSCGSTYVCRHARTIGEIQRCSKHFLANTSNTVNLLLVILVVVIIVQ
jgi:hypothetical protein